MAIVAITGWKTGCNTVKAIKQIRVLAEMPLDAALAVVNRVLNNEVVMIPVASTVSAQTLVDELAAFGLIASIDGD